MSNNEGHKRNLPVPYFSQLEKTVKTTSVCLICLFCVFGLPACDKNTGDQNAPPSQEASMGENTQEETSPSAAQPVAETQEPALENETGVFDYAYTGATELKNVMPNSWQNLKRLTQESEEIFFAENAELMEMMAENAFQLEMERPDGWNKPGYFKAMVYEENIGTDTFLRIVQTTNKEGEIGKIAERFLQWFVYKGPTANILITMQVYNMNGGGQFLPTLMPTSIDIVRSGGRAKGVLVTVLEVACDYDAKNGWYYVPVPNAGTAGYMLEQLVGRVNARYYLMDDVHEGMTAKDLEYPDIPKIWIYASDCLVDPAVPLRYALQSAFDGNPATSYVANTKDGLFTLWFDISNDDRAKRIPIPGITKLALINGYAQNEDLYFANNRIKKITVLEETELADGTLGFQFVDVPPECQSMNVTELYRGEKYNDTCMAEFNIKLDNTGWLFGDIDE